MDQERLKMPTIVTERLILRPVCEADAIDMLEYGTDQEVTRFLSWKPYQTIEDVYGSLNYYFFKRVEMNIPESQAIIYKANGKMIGLCDFVHLDEHHRCGEIGYVLNKNYWGQGIMVEACQEVIKYGFEVLDLVRIQISHDIRNHQSARVIEKLGFTYEGIKRNGLIRWDGEICTLKTYSIVQSEYKNNELPWQSKSR